MAKKGRGKKKEKKKACVEDGDGTAAGAVPLDVVQLILLKASPLTLWASRLVCKPWYALITSPEFVAARRSATGGAWLATLHPVTTQRCDARTKTRLVKAARIFIYNPLLNIQEEVSVPIRQAWPKAKILMLYDLCGSWDQHRMRIRAVFVEPADPVSGSLLVKFAFTTWNPVSGAIGEVFHPTSECYSGSIPPQDVAGPGWTRRYTENHSALMAFSVSGLKIFRQSMDGCWEFMGAMPDDMWQLMRESECLFVDTPLYYLIWTQHAREPEMLALFQPTKSSWTWVGNIWRSRYQVCGWKEVKPVVFSCF